MRSVLPSALTANALFASAALWAFQPALAPQAEPQSRSTVARRSWSPWRRSGWGPISPARSAPLGPSFDLSEKLGPTGFRGTGNPVDGGPGPGKWTASQSRLMPDGASWADGFRARDPRPAPLLDVPAPRI